MMESGAAIPFEIRVRREIWESFVSMLRVYASAAAGHGEFIVTAFPGAAWIKHKDNILALCFEPADGTATWSFTKADVSRQRGSFQILESGFLSFDGQEKQLDEAAIDWIEDLARAGRNVEEKVEV